MSAGKSGGMSSSAPAPTAAPVAPPPEPPEQREPGDLDRARRRAAAVKTEEDELTGLKSSIEEKDKPKAKTLLGL